MTVLQESFTTQLPFPGAHQAQPLPPPSLCKDESWEILPAQSPVGTGLSPCQQAQLLACWAGLATSHITWALLVLALETGLRDTGLDG